MIDVGSKARDLFFDVAALGDERGFLQNAVLIEASVEHGLEALTEALDIGLLDLFAQGRRFVDEGAESFHVGAELVGEERTFLGAHGLQSGDQRIRFAKNSFFKATQLFVAVARFGHQNAGQAKDGVEVGFSGEPMLGGGGAKSFHVGGHECVVIPCFGLLAAFEVQRDFNVAPAQLFLQQPAQLNLNALGARRQTHVEIEKTVVHALQAERKTQRVGNPAGDPCKPGHGGNRRLRPGLLRLRLTGFSHRSVFPMSAGSVAAVNSGSSGRADRDAVIPASPV